MADPGGRLASLGSAAADCRRGLESRLSGLADQWNDEARRKFDAQHAAPVLEGARALERELGAVAQTAARAAGQLKSR
jgi:hypothetical protein